MPYEDCLLRIQNFRSLSILVWSGDETQINLYKQINIRGRFTDQKQKSAYSDARFNHKVFYLFSLYHQFVETNFSNPRGAGVSEFSIFPRIAVAFFRVRVFLKS